MATGVVYDDPEKRPKKYNEWMAGLLNTPLEESDAEFTLISPRASRLVDSRKVFRLESTRK